MQIDFDENRVVAANRIVTEQNRQFILQQIQATAAALENEPNRPLDHLDAPGLLEHARVQYANYLGDLGRRAAALYL